ncbi:MAG: hypothetical protein GY884_06500 [Proteobacteria bacterium]|nr:hypothetical protein [Pseudomonadota bacterium]
MVGALGRWATIQPAPPSGLVDRIRATRDVLTDDDHPGSALLRRNYKILLGLAIWMMLVVLMGILNRCAS